MHRCWTTKVSENILVRGLWEGCGNRPNISPFAHQRSSHEQKQKDLFWRFYNILIFIFILFIQYAPFWGKDYVRPFPNTLSTESKGKMTKYWHFFCFCNALLHENHFFWRRIDDPVMASFLYLFKWDMDMNIFRSTFNQENIKFVF